MKKSRYLVLSLLMALTIGLAGCSLFDKDEDKKDDDKKEEQVQEDVKENRISEKEIVIYAEEDDQNAYDLLNEKVELEVEDYDWGVMIKSINGLESSNEYFWALYVNGEMSMTGAKATTLKKGDEMKWIYEEIKPM